MTFDEWFQQEIVPQFHYSNDDPWRYESIARQAWEAGYEEGVADSDPAVERPTNAQN
jgi:hypothetical protein